MAAWTRILTSVAFEGVVILPQKLKIAYTAIVG
jgi:hypothetical protein